jgi:tetratricopeptide (TPR) repeat protein
MDEFYEVDEQNFNALMAQAIGAQRAGNNAEARDLRLQALAQTPADSVERARALREVAASNLKLGEVDQALEGATASIEILEGHLNHDPSVLRELAASEQMAGRANYPDKPDEAHTYLQKAWNHITDSETAAHFRHGWFWPRNIDQYRINMAPRVAVSEAVAGDRQLALSIGSKAVGLALLSESGVIANGSPQPLLERWKNRTQQAVMGMASLAVAVMASPERRGPRHSAARRLGRLVMR